MNELLKIMDEDSLDFNELAASWYKTYRKSSDRAAVQLLSLLYCVAGAKNFEITTDDLHCPTELFLKIVVKNVDGDDIINHDTLNKFIQLIEFILKQGAHILFKDCNFMNTIQKTISLFAKKEWMPYKLTSVVFGRKLMTAFLAFDSAVMKELDKARDQLKKLKSNSQEEQSGGEEEKPLTSKGDAFDDLIGRKSQAKDVNKIRKEIASLEKKLQTVKPNEMEPYFLLFYETIFLECLGSRETDIRKYCHGVMRSWMKFTSLDYLIERYFTLLHKMVNDPADELRTSSIQTYLLWLNTNLKLATSSKDMPAMVRRLVRISYDSVDEVQITALKCLNIIAESCNPDLINPKLAEKVYHLVYCKERTVAIEAGKFVHRRILSTTGKDSAAYIRVVAEFYQESQESQRLDLLIDGLLNESFTEDRLLVHWEAWSTLLKGSDDLDEIDMEVLVRLLLATLKQANTGMIPFERLTDENKKQKRASPSVVLQNIENSSEILRDTVLELWENYKNNYKLFCPLLKCISYMTFSDVGFYTLLSNMLRFQLIANNNLAICSDCCITFALMCKKILNLEIDASDPDTKRLLKCIKIGAVRISDRLESCTNDLLKNLNEGNQSDVDDKMLKNVALCSWIDIMDNQFWLAIYLEATKLMNSDQKDFEQFIRLYMVVCYTSLFWIGVYFVEENMKGNSVGDGFLDKLRFISRTYFLRLDDTVKGTNKKRKKMASRIISSLKKASVYIEKNNGIPFLIYDNIIE